MAVGIQGGRPKNETIKADINKMQIYWAFAYYTLTFALDFNTVVSCFTPSSPKETFRSVSEPTSELFSTIEATSST
jgi:hypothetical protein